MGRTTERLMVKNFVDMVKASEGATTNIRSVEVDAIVDTGATFVCISKMDIERLGLTFNMSVDIKTANGKASRRIFKGSHIELKGRSFVMDVMENEEDTPALIGYLLLEALDYVVDPRTQGAIPNPAHEGKWVADLYCSRRLQPAFLKTLASACGYQIYVNLTP